MKLVTYSINEGAYHIGELADNHVYPLDANVTMREFIEQAIPAERTGHGISLESVHIHAPIKPNKIIAIGRNYAEHAAELANKLPEKPLIFAKNTSSIIADGDTIEWQADITQQVDWEGELAVIIGKQARHVPENEAYEYIFGYTVANDVSARDLQSGDGQWTRAKGLDTFCPLGPAIVTLDEITDPQNLSLQTRVNDNLMQDGSTRDMVFKIPYLIAYCSRMFTFEAGDILLTGTPAGVGKGMTPPRFLGTGDEVSISIEGIGILTNPCRIVD